MGYLPETMRNYLLRLGWSHGNDEIIPTAAGDHMVQSRQIGKSPARLDFKKLDNLNAHYLRAVDDAALVAAYRAAVAARAAAPLTPRRASGLLAGMPEPEGARQDAGRTGAICGVSVRGRAAHARRPGRQGDDAGGAH